MNAIETPARPNRPVYLDNQATTRCDARVLAAMLPWFSEAYGNPASAEHQMGRAAAEAVDRARAQVASLIGADSKEIIFTSGATESNNIAIKGATRYARASGDPRRRIITLVTEHKCVLECFADAAEDGFDPLFLPVRPDGLVDPDRLQHALAMIAAAETSGKVILRFPGMRFSSEPLTRSPGMAARRRESKRSRRRKSRSRSCAISS